MQIGWSFKELDIFDRGVTSAGQNCAAPVARPNVGGRLALARCQTCRSTIDFFSVAICLAGFRPFGQAFEQFRMVWQR